MIVVRASRVEQGSSAARTCPRPSGCPAVVRPARRGANDYRDVADDDIVQNYFRIERVEPGALWLTGDVGPLK